MEFSFGGSYKNYKIVQNAERPNEIDLHNNVTGHKKPFLKIKGSPNTNRLRLILNPGHNNYNQNKKIKALMLRKWYTFYKPTEIYGDIENTTSDFLLYVSKSIRDFKLNDLLE